METFDRPKGSTILDDYLCDLSLMLEVRNVCTSIDPFDFDRDGSVLVKLSKHLAWATRHSEEAIVSQSKWVSLRKLIPGHGKTFGSPELLFICVMSNPKARYEFSRPIYTEYSSTREPSRVSGYPTYVADIYIRARQGYSVSDDPWAGMVRLNDDNLPTTCIHGTSVNCIKSILEDGLIPGGLVLGSRKAVRFSATWPTRRM